MAQWLLVCAISHKTVAFGAKGVNFAEAKPHCQQHKCSPGSLVFGNMWFTEDDMHYLYSS